MGKPGKGVLVKEAYVPEKICDSKSDRRIRGSRLNVSFPVLATFRGMLIQGYVEAVDISWSGMLLATNFPLSKGDELTLEFTLPEHVIPIAAQARVVHRVTEMTPEQATLVGVVFTGLDPNIVRILTGYVLEKLPGV